MALGAARRHPAVRLRGRPAGSPRQTQGVPAPPNKSSESCVVQDPPTARLRGRGARGGPPASDQLPPQPQGQTPRGREPWTRPGGCRAACPCPGRREAARREQPARSLRRPLTSEAACASHVFVKLPTCRGLGSGANIGSAKPTLSILATDPLACSSSGARGTSARGTWAPLNRRRYKPSSSRARSRPWDHHRRAWREATPDPEHHRVHMSRHGSTPLPTTCHTRETLRQT